MDETSREKSDSRQLIPNESRLQYNESRSSGSGVGVKNDVLLDVEFSLNDGQEKVLAHKFILLDSPPSQFFSEKLVQNVGLVVINVPDEINSASVDAMLNFIYGKQLIELGISHHDFDLKGFMNCANFFQMEIMLLEQLAPILRVPDQRLETYISDHFQRLKTDQKFWSFQNPVILQLCRALDPDIVENGYLEWLQENRAQRWKYFDKFVELRRRLRNSDPVPDDQGNPVPVDLETDSITPETEHSGSVGGGSCGNDIPSTSKEVEQENKRRMRKRSFVYDSVTDEDLDEERDSEVDAEEPSNNPSNGTSSKVLKPSSFSVTNQKRAKKSKQSKTDRFFINRLNYIRTQLTRKQWRTKKFTEAWTTVCDYMTLKPNESQATKNVQMFVDTNGIDLLLESRRAIQDKISKYPAFCEAFLKIVYHFPGDEHMHVINSDEILTYLLEDLNNRSLKVHCSTLAGQVLARILNSYSPLKWTFATSRELVSNQLKEVILNIWNLSVKGLNTLQKLSNLKELVRLINSDDPAACLCGLFLMVYHTQSDEVGSKNENAIKYVDYLKDTSLEERLIYLENFGDPNGITYSKKLINILGYTIDNFLKKHMYCIRAYVANGTWEWESKGFTDAWVSVSRIMYREGAKKVFSDQNGVTLLIESRKVLGDEYHKYPDFFNAFLSIISSFSLYLEDSYASLAFINEIVEFILKDIVRYDVPKDSVMAGTIATQFLRLYGPNAWQSISKRELVATRVEKSIIEHWDFNIELKGVYPNFDFLLDMIGSNDRTVNLFGVWMLICLTKSDTGNEERNKRAKMYVDDFRTQISNSEALVRFVQQREDSRLSNLAKQLLANYRIIVKIS